MVELLEKPKLPSKTIPPITIKESGGVDRQKLASWSGQPVFITGEETEEKKAVNRLILLKKAFVTRQLLSSAATSEGGRKILLQFACEFHCFDHLWIPEDCRIPVGNYSSFVGFVTCYTRDDGSQSWGVRAPASEAELKHALIRFTTFQIGELDRALGDRKMTYKKSTKYFEGINKLLQYICYSKKDNSLEAIALLGIDEQVKINFVDAIEAFLARERLYYKAINKETTKVKIKSSKRGFGK